MKRILLLLMLTWGAGSVAQERFDDLVRRNPWNGGVNAAGVRQDTVSRSYAEVHFTKENGGWTDHSGSDDSWNAGAETKSVRHFEKVSFFGRFAYDYFDGRNMCGSMLSRPGYYPVDILEFTPGRKVCETYAFTGGIAARLGRRWTGGLRADFEAGNYAKRRDLRHKNMSLDFEIAPGVMYRAGRFAAGAAYIFSKNSDKVEAEQIGKKGDSYYAFFDKGLYYGTQELWDGSNIHLAESGIDGFPMKETGHGASAQVQFGPLYVEATYRRTDGDTGEKDLTWHAFGGNRYSARAVLSLRSAAYGHFVRLDFDWREQDLREMLVGKENINGVTVNKVYGSTPVSGRKNAEAGGEYEIASERFHFRAGGRYSQTGRRSTLMYPYTREQKLHFAECFARGRRGFGRFELTAGVNCRWGGFSERSTTLAGGDTGDYPLQLTAYYDREAEYLTATRLGAELAVRCNIKRFYIDLSGRYEHGFGIRYAPGAERGAATIGVGYNF